MTNSIEFEAARVAAAFGVKDVECLARCRPFWKEYRGDLNGVGVHWRLGWENQIQWIQTLDDGWDTWFNMHHEEWSVCATSQGAHAILMARGLYCLGFTDETILSQLPQLSGHERLELRLNLPREFWPQAWFNEMAQ